MVQVSRLWWWLRLGLGVAAVCVPAILPAADSIKGAGKVNSQHETVEIFTAIESGQIEAQVIPKDSTQVCLLVKNKSGKPLNVKLPAALAGVPVLAQFQFPPNGNLPGNNANGPQPLGLGNPMGNPANQAFFNVGNRPGPLVDFFAFNIAPEQVAQLKLPAVCLEHGKPEPRPQMTYQLKPLESVSDKPGLPQLCAMLGRGEVGQTAAQAAAWHLANGMSWKQLKAERVKIAFGRLSEPSFTERELAEGQKAAEKAVALVKQPTPAAQRESASAK